MDSDANSVICEIARSRVRDERLDLLALLESTQGGQPGSALVDTQNAGKETVYRRLGEFVDIGFVADQDGEVFELTRAGEKAVAAYRRVTDRVDDEIIAYLAGSPARGRTLEHLLQTPARKATLADNDQLPSRTTIHRIVTEFDERGWTQRTADGAIRLTTPAAKTYEEYEWLRVAIEQAIQKAPCLQRLAEWADPRLHLLAGTTLTMEQEGDPHALLNAAVEAANIRDGTLSEVRSITPLFEPLMFDVFGEFIDRGTEFQVVFDQRSYEELTQPSNAHYLAGALLSPNVSVRVHPERLHTGLGIYDDAVLLGGSTTHERQAGVVGADEEFLSWATTTFDEIWAESVPPSDRLRSWVRQAVPTPYE